MRMPMVLLASACLVGAVVAGEPGGRNDDVGKPGPTLMSSGWDGAPVSLDAAKGNAVLLAFWDSKATCWGAGALRAGLARDYEVLKKKYPNMTFIAICSTPGADVRSMQNEEVVMKIKDLPFTKMLDANGATLAAYHMAPDIPYQLVVLDHEGKIVFNGNSMVSLRGSDGTAVPLRVSAAEKALKAAPGMLGDVKAPESMAQAMHLFSLQQFDRMDAELVKARKADTSAEAKQFAELLEKKVAELRAKRLEELTALTESDPIKAFREVDLFLLCFPRSKEATAAKSLQSKLNGNSKVRMEKEAQNTFNQVVMPAMQRVRTRKQYDLSVAATVQGYLKKYDGTEFVKIAQACTDAHVKTLR